ncbi:helicase domain protein [Halothece sp. PCC 7418]|uniref:helicase-related protein n=1 Tax=Halothece sp. (strain PCC 7418) TaxID=65093 RepID=UPI0002A05CD1|nr:helicase-related protein [Halothece sp. PCC 7418]AFZ44347.1 helicase domain protein [Halothece sp. PCC 7418]
MNLLIDRAWKTKYDSDTESLVKEFYEPALERAVRYDRATGFFSAKVMTLAMRGLEGLIHNQGRMRLIIGCTLGEAEVTAIERGEKLKAVVEEKLTVNPLTSNDSEEIDALELLSWMIAQDYLEIKLALPCSAERKAIPAQGIFHEKAGVIEDKAGNRLAFNGSVNETAKGWRGNWESFHVFTDWGGTKTYVDDEETGFAKLWANQAKRCLVIDVPQAVTEQLLHYLPPNDQKPKRLEKVETELQPTTTPSPKPEPITLDPQPEDLYRKVWTLIQQGPAIPGRGDYVGEATSTVTPWPHQIKTFQRLYHHWPPTLLIADEVGLGKTIEAGLLLRQAWLSGKAKRILILAPKSVLTQWQIELREKFNLNWPIYDGKALNWYDCPAWRALGKNTIQPVSRETWHQEPCTIVSSHLMRRRDRARELIEDAESYDLIILDEAHHARRRGAGGTQQKGPNLLLSLMQQLKYKTQGLILLTATPMQIDPIEVWDLLSLFGLPPEWNVKHFQDFFECASSANPSNAQFEFMARLFRSVEAAYGETPLEAVQKYVPKQSKLAAKKILNALRDEATLPRRQLNSDRRRAAIEIMKANTPVGRLLSRHTRQLLRRYYEAGKISTRIATRQVEDKFVSLSSQEKTLYDAVEDYIASTYNNATQAEKNAVGFVMTIYRRRLASSFAALARTLSQRLNRLERTHYYQPTLIDEDILDDEASEEIMDEDQANQLEQEALKNEEVRELAWLREQIEALPTDTKAQVLLDYLQQVKQEGYQQIIVFSQYTDTMDFLRQYLASVSNYKIVCFSGRGGEIPTSDSTWQRISRDKTKQIFRDGKADILLCTDAAAEGLNFQFCGAMINYDMPWNPMRVEQRIGRIDRLGQKYPTIKILNLHYQDTVETDVYIALRDRIGLFSQYVGKLQPILSSIPKNFATVALANRDEKEQKKADLVETVNEDVKEKESDSFDLDQVTDAELEEPLRPEPLYNFETLDQLIQRVDLRPPGLEIERLQSKEYKFSMPGMSEVLRVTTAPDYFEQHPDSTELWSPGSPLFPIVEGL